MVQLFARIDGELDQPLPLQLTGSTVIRPSLASANMTPVGWSLSNERGDLLARGGGLGMGMAQQDQFTHQTVFLNHLRMGAQSSWWPRICSEW